MARPKPKSSSMRKRVEQHASDETSIDEAEETREATSSFEGPTSFSDVFDSTSFAPKFSVRRAQVKYADTNIIYPLLDQFAEDAATVNLLLGLTTLFLGVAATCLVGLITAQTSIQGAVLFTASAAAVVITTVLGGLTWRASRRASRTRERLLSIAPERHASNKKRAK